MTDTYRAMADQHLITSMAKQLCSVCGLPSVEGLKYGFGKCKWHWTAGNWGRKWALQSIGAEPLPPSLMAKPTSAPSRRALEALPND
jgi:hypothetical protein